MILIMGETIKRVFNEIKPFAPCLRKRNRPERCHIDDISQQSHAQRSRITRLAVCLAITRIAAIIAAASLSAVPYAGRVQPAARRQTAEGYFTPAFELCYYLRCAVIKRNVPADAVRATPFRWSDTLIGIQIQRANSRTAI
ncbi:hypothetical protein EVAR_24997_1 [Eumeta japonica]|uniref:Uncharacterized protein n=1 Tax=Eumeta variegata TaxID=151549 RepID=A0A4C1XIT2_EUMVA|nr:hypothetical protein EVAR_24997_1 [Eumeta japonica]